MLPRCTHCSRPLPLQVGRPELHGKPLAVCHSNSSKGTGEVSAANYEARKYGIHAGMFIAEAKRRCATLIVVPYEFDRCAEGEVSRAAGLLGAAGGLEGWAAGLLAL